MSKGILIRSPNSGIILGRGKNHECTLKCSVRKNSLNVIGCPPVSVPFWLNAWQAPARLMAICHRTARTRCGCDSKLNSQMSRAKKTKEFFASRQKTPRRKTANPSLTLNIPLTPFLVALLTFFFCRSVSSPLGLITFRSHTRVPLPLHPPQRHLQAIVCVAVNLAACQHPVDSCSIGAPGSMRCMHRACTTMP